jgi:hypothetical protein
VRRERQAGVHSCGGVSENHRKVAERIRCLSTHTPFTNPPPDLKRHCAVEIYVSGQTLHAVGYPDCLRTSAGATSASKMTEITRFAVF